MRNHSVSLANKRLGGRPRQRVLKHRNRVIAAIAALSMWPAMVVAEATAFFDAIPTSGPAPLTVRFCASAGIGVDFGDGVSSGMGPPSGACPRGGVSVTHTYTAAGVYRLRGFPCPGSQNTNCGEVAQKAAAVVITVTAP
jgi:hypothetical protein